MFGILKKFVDLFPPSVRRHVFGIKDGSTFGSKFRRIISRAAALAILVLIFFTINDKQTYLGVLSVGLITSIFSVSFFIFVVFAVLILTSQSFRPAPVRLIRDTLLSIGLNILSFAQLYRAIGIIHPEKDSVATAWDCVYFSAVTFSTLGYGDFQPSESARLVAAAQALIGNLHLGVIVGAAFLAAQPPTSKVRQ